MAELLDHCQSIGELCTRIKVIEPKLIDVQETSQISVLISRLMPEVKWCIVTNFVPFPLEFEALPSDSSQLWYSGLRQ